MSDPNSLIDSLLRGVAVAAVNRAVFKGQPVFSMGTVNEGVRLGAASVGYDLIVRPAVKQVLPMIPLPNGGAK
tara:strand:+ start:278 stop:496 length:219 start_codon:yes stop_codon:yes gene_type:complete